jgi:hypothetical protein
MIIFEYILFEIFELLVAKGTPMVSCNRLLNADFAIDMPAACDVAIVDGIEADCALKLML